RGGARHGTGSRGAGAGAVRARVARAAARGTKGSEGPVIPATIVITEKHIADGKPKNIGLCALALAVKDAFAAAGEPLRNVEVDSDGEQWFVCARQGPVGNITAHWADLETPQRQWVEAFDAGEPV